MALAIWISKLRSDMLEQRNLYFIENKIDYSFKNKDLLIEAFTHSSYANKKMLQSNERLEFLGDSVLNYATTIYLFNNFGYTEGESSKIRAYLVSSENVSKFIFDNQLEDFLLCDNFNPQKSTNVMGDLYESIVGAMLLDSNLEQCKKFIYSSLKYSTQLIQDILTKTKDYKTELQEIVQKKQNSTLQYVLMSKNGPAHLPSFEIEVNIDGKTFGKATAHSKKDAENLAAKATIHMLNKEK